MNDREPSETVASLAEIRSQNLQRWLENVRKQIRDQKTKNGIEDAESSMSSLPDLCEMQSLVELVGSASLLSEEGTYYQLAVLYLSREHGPTTLSGLMRCALNVDIEAQRLEPSSLAKLAPLSHPNHTYLLIDKCLDNGFACWGIVDLTTRLTCPSNPDEKNPSPGEKDASFRFPQLDLAQEPDALWLHSLHPGHVEGGWGDRVILLREESDFLIEGGVGLPTLGHSRD